MTTTAERITTTESHEDAFEQLAPSHPRWIANSKEAQPDPREIVSCSNGLLHLPTDSFLGHRPDFFSMASVGIDYTPDAPDPERWLSFLEELWPADRHSQRLLQEWFGLSLVQDTSYQKALFIVGPGSSGKTTIARILSALLLDDSVVCMDLPDLVSRHGMYGLIDKTTAIMEGLCLPPRGRGKKAAFRDTQSSLKKFLQILGEDPVVIERPYLRPAVVQLPTRFLVLSNVSPPGLEHADDRAWFASRVMALHLERSFKGDPLLTERLRDELPGILNWSIHGLKRLRHRGGFDDRWWAA